MIQRIKTKWASSPFGTLERRAVVYEWLLHNIIFGFAGVWVPAITLHLFSIFSWRKPLLDGEMIMFAVTLSAVSLGFFNKATQVRLRQREMLTYVGLMLVMLFGVIVRTALALASEFKDTLKLDSQFVGWMTAGLVVIAICLNFRLFTIELAAANSGAIQERLNLPAVEMASEASGANNVDGIRL